MISKKQKVLLNAHQMTADIKHFRYLLTSKRGIFGKVIVLLSKIEKILLKRVFAIIIRTLRQPNPFRSRGTYREECGVIEDPHAG